MSFWDAFAILEELAPEPSAEGESVTPPSAAEHDAAIERWG